MDRPSVSVIIPTHNSARTVRACLRSVLEADYEGDVEVIVVDDGSTDETGTVAEEFPCRLIRQSPSRGPAAARNTGARAARNELLLFIDSDTEMLPNTISEGVKELDGPGVAAVCGVYEREPVNDGFFPRYYAYLKSYAFQTSPADRLSAFGAQCAVISKKLFREVGGFRAFPWGMDLENDELGARINQHGKIALCRSFNVKHNFPHFRKLLYVFTSRIYWWTIFRHFSGRAETVLLTRGFGYATAALPAALLWLVGTALVAEPPASFYGHIVTAVLVAWFVTAYLGFWGFSLRHRGAAFAVGSVLASVLFAFVITAGAARGYLTVAWMQLLRREPVYPRAAPGQL